MSAKKPVPIFPQHDTKFCPVCGKPSYSRDGIHPQCAVVQADAPRQKQLAEEKKQLANTKKEQRAKSLSKKCPDCHLLVHVRQKTCACGHVFK